MSANRRLGLGGALLALLSLGGCSATVDQFSNRARAYNDQADTIKEQQLLLNIMRAAYREPMEFSDFTQVTGQNAVSGTLGFSLPISAFPTNAPRSYLTTPSATVSGNQSFTVANLDTQAFYEGLLSPVPLETLDYYMEADYPRALVLTLFVDKVKLTPVPASQPGEPAAASIIYENSYQYGRYQPFKAIIDTAIFAGLDTEIVQRVKPIGPPMTARQLSEVKDLAALTTDGVTLKTYELHQGAQASGKMAAASDPELSTASLMKILPPGTTEYYRLVSTNSVPRFCFDAAGAAALDTPRMTATINAYLHSEYALPNSLNLINISIPPGAYWGGAAANGHDSADGGGDSVGGETTTPLQLTLQPAASAQDGPALKFQVVITTRSVEQMIYYLGEWTRAEIGVAGARLAPPLVSSFLEAPGAHIAQAPFSGPAAEGSGDWPGTEDILFQVQPGTGCASNFPDVHVSYFDGSYCMQIDPTGHDRSSQVMEIISQLFALNNDAKNLPAPNVISVLSP